MARSIYGGLVNVTKATLPGMLRRGRGEFVSFASMSGQWPVMYMGPTTPQSMRWLPSPRCWTTRTATAAYASSASARRRVATLLLKGQGHCLAQAARRISVPIKSGTGARPHRPHPRRLRLLGLHRTVHRHVVAHAALARRLHVVGATTSSRSAESGARVMRLPKSNHHQGGTEASGRDQGAARKRVRQGFGALKQDGRD